MQAVLVDSITCSFSVKNMKKTEIVGHKKGLLKCNGTIERILPSTATLKMCFSSGKKRSFTVFAGRKYSEHFDLIVSCLLWTVRIIYLNLMLLLFHLRETLSFQGSYGLSVFFINL